MKKCQTVINPLRRDGTSQPQRYPVDIDPDRIGIDEKELDDFLVFVKHLGNEVNFFKDNPSTVYSKWTPFFEDDISIVLAGIVQADLATYQTAFLAQYEILLGLLDDLFAANQTIPPSGSDPLAQKIVDAFDAMYQILLIDPVDSVSMVGLVDNWLQKVGSETGLETLLLSQTASEMQPALEDLAIIFYEIGAHLMADTAIFPTLPTTVTNPNSFNGFEPEWGDFASLFASLATASPVYYAGNNDFEKVSRTLQGIKTNFEKFVSSASLVISETKPFLMQSLNDYDLHEPSVAMYLAFVQLFKYAEDHINELTARHLFFYYEDVLRFQKRGPISDRAHLILQLRDGADDFRIEEGTRFYAGLDALGNDRYYEAEQEVVLNQAEVVELKSVFVSDLREKDYSSPLEKGREIYAAEVANSRDGKGEALEDGAPFWDFMGKDQKGIRPDERTMADSRLGFAVASPILFLQSGKRVTRFMFRIAKGSALSNLSSNELSDLEVELLSSLKMRLSGEKEWFEANAHRLFIFNSAARLADLDNAASYLAGTYVHTPDTFHHPSFADSLGTVDFNQFNYLLIELVLEPNMPALMPYKAELGGNYDTEFPIAEFTFGNDGITLAPEGLAELVPGSPAFGSYVKFGGRLVNEIGSMSLNYLGQASEYLAEYYEAYDESKSYTYNQYAPLNSAMTDYVLYDEKVYRAIKNSNSPSPEGNYEYWDYQFIAPPVSPHPDYDPDTTYSINDLVVYKGDIYKAIKDSTSPLPDRNPDFWTEVEYSANPYVYLKDVNVLEMDIHVDVYGHSTFTVENDAGELNPEKPFEAFGYRPVSGNRLMIGSAEVFSKRLSKLSISYRWLDMPNSLPNYFSSYSNPPSSNSQYTVRAYLLEKGSFINVSPSSHPLFHPTTAGFYNAVTLDFEAGSGSLHYDTYGRGPFNYQNQPFDAKLKRGFIRLDLSGPGIMFGHEDFPKEIALSPSPLPNEPLVPKMKDLTIFYSSKVRVNLTSKAESVYRNRVEQFFHVHPFGQAEVHPATQIDESNITLTPNYDPQGHLFIGLRDLDPPRTLGLLFQQLDGSGSPDVAFSEVQWDVMVDNQWQSIPPIDVVWDSTNKLKRTGIVRFNLPRKISNDNRVLTPGLHWLRASIAENVLGLNKAVTIQAQAVEVVFQDNANDPEHFRNPLPAATIKELEFSRNEVDKVLQPYATFNGKLAEERDPFFTRVSERLRHKDRSSLVWDYERMVLEEYPEIFKAKCLNHTNDDCEIAPGSVRVITVPNLRNKNAVNLFEPRTSLDLLTEIEGFLNETVSCFVDLKVQNPLYEQIKVYACIGFRTGYDPGYYLNQLKTDIQKFLSPWAFDEGAEIVFGGRIHRSVILNFIEEREYVDFVVNFRMDHIIGDMVCEDVLEAVTTTSRSILVTSQSHSLKAVTSCEHYCEGSVLYEGVDFWIIETDFEAQ